MKRVRMKQVVCLMVFAMAFAFMMFGKLPVNAKEMSEAMPISLQGQSTGKINLEGDEIPYYYTFELANAGKVAITMRQYIYSGYVEVYDADGVYVWGAGNTFRYTGATATSPRQDTTSLTIPKGRYYLMVWNEDRDAGYVELSLKLTDFKADPKYGDSFDNPKSISLEKTVTGVMISDNDRDWSDIYGNSEDWYKIQIKHDGMYREVVTTTDKAPQIYLYDTNISEKRHEWNVGHVIELSAGTYYVKASGGRGKYTYKMLQFVPAKGDVYTVDNLKYEVTKSSKTSGTVRVIGMYDSWADTVDIPSSVKLDGISFKVTEVKSNAFYNHYNVKKAIIGKNVKTIGSQAFASCKNLKTITIKSTGLTSKSVKSRAFKGIYEKARIKVPSSKVNSYKKLLVSKGVSKKATVKK